MRYCTCYNIITQPIRHPSPEKKERTLWPNLDRCGMAVILKLRQTTSHLLQFDGLLQQFIGSHTALSLEAAKISQVGLLAQRY